MFGRRIASTLAIGIVVAGGLAGCEKIKSTLGFGGGAADTPCSDSAKLSTLVLQDGRYQLGPYQFSLLGDVKHGDVFGHTQVGTPPASVFIGNCVADGQTSQVLFVYGTDENGKPKRLAAEELSDGGGGTAGSFDVKDGTIVVEQNQDGKPTEITYALLNGKMTNLTTGSTSEAADNTGGTDTVSFEVFHDKLQPYGRWIDHPRWGQVWHPTQGGFRPYENGHWEDSDEYGTVWVSNDSWGDETTHYGRWAYDPNYGGWLWAPGYVWGPSWVVWRASDEYVGWFPMPPGQYDGEGEFVDDWGGWYGYHGWYPGFDEAAFYGLWSFVAPDDIYAVDVRTRIIDRRGYGRFIGRSRAWSHYGISHGRVFSRGLDRGRFREAFHHDAPGSRHDFKGGGRATSVRQGHAIAAHERAGGHERSALGRGNQGGRGVQHAGGAMGGRGSQGGIGRNGTGGGHFGGGANGVSRSGNGFARSGSGMGGRNGISHSGNSFARSGGGSNGFSRSGNGFSRSGGGGSNGFSRSGGGSNGVSRSSGGGNGFARSGGGGGNSFGGLGHNGGGNGGGGGLGGFGHAGGGGMGGMVQQHQGFGGGSHPAPVRAPSGGGGNHHH